MTKHVHTEAQKQFTRLELSSFLHDLQQQEPILCDVKDGNKQCIAPTQSAVAVCCVLDSATENFEETLDADKGVDAKSDLGQELATPVVDTFSILSTLNNGVESGIGDSGGGVASFCDMIPVCTASLGKVSKTVNFVDSAPDTNVFNIEDEMDQYWDQPVTMWKHRRLPITNDPPEEDACYWKWPGSKKDGNFVSPDKQMSNLDEARAIAVADLQAAEIDGTELEMSWPVSIRAEEVLICGPQRGYSRVIMRPFSKEKFDEAISNDSFKDLVKDHFRTDVLSDCPKFSYYDENWLPEQNKVLDSVDDASDTGVLSTEAPDSDQITDISNSEDCSSESQSAVESGDDDSDVEAKARVDSDIRPEGLRESSDRAEAENLSIISSSIKLKK